MADKTTLTVEDCMKAAFQALLRGDTDQRDKLCALVERKMEGQPVAWDANVLEGTKQNG